jgi:hypothetical protein
MKKIFFFLLLVLAGLVCFSQDNYVLLAKAGRYEKVFNRNKAIKVFYVENNQYKVFKGYMVKADEQGIYMTHFSRRDTAKQYIPCAHISKVKLVSRMGRLVTGVAAGTLFVIGIVAINSATNDYNSSYGVITSQEIGGITSLAFGYLGLITFGSIHLADALSAKAVSNGWVFSTKKME